MSKSTSENRKSFGGLADSIGTSIVLVLILASFVHLVLRQVFDTHQIYALREITMILTAVLVLTALHVLREDDSKAQTNTTVGILQRLSFFLLATSFITCAVFAFQNGAKNPLFPVVNLGWLIGLGAISISLAAFKPRYKTISNVGSAPLFMGLIALGFLIFDGVEQGLVTVGTVVWNVATDFELPPLISILALYFLVEVLLKPRSRLDARENHPNVFKIRQSLSVAVVFALVMGIEIQPALTPCGVAVLIAVVFCRVRAMRSTGELNRSFALGSDLTRFGIAMFVATCALMLTVRGSAHIGEAASVGFLGLALVGILVRWIDLANLRALLEDISRSALFLGGAFILAALWNLFANGYLNLNSALSTLGIPDVAVFPIGLLAMLGLSLRIGPLPGMVAAAPLLYLGLETFVWPAAWSAPAVAGTMFMTLWMQGRIRHARASRLAGATLLIGLIVSAFGFAKPDGAISATSAGSSPPGNAREVNVGLADGRTVSPNDLIPNTWVRVRASGQAPPRPDHGGSAFDERRRQILLFGADTHHRDWRNTVTAFDLNSQRWNSHYRSSPRYALRADAAGNRISGIVQELPWPMHTYDGVVYHPKIDSLVVAAAPLHSLKAVPNGRFDPTWIYDLKSKRWRKGPATGEKTPRFFGGTAIYDSQRNSIFYFNSVAAEHGHLPIGRESRFFNFDLFQLSEDLSEWTRVSDPPPQWRSEAMRQMLVESGKPGFNAEFERRTGDMILFMGNALGTRILRYTHDHTDNHDHTHGHDHRRRTFGQWRSAHVRDGNCDSGVPYAVAHSRNGQYLLRPSRTRPARNLTCNYNIDRDAMVPLMAAEPLRGRMNFNLHYDTVSGLFVLIHGVSLHGGRASVRYLRLDS